jgi:hypothetical protein
VVTEIIRGGRLSINFESSITNPESGTYLRGPLTDYLKKKKKGIKIRNDTDIAVEVKADYSIPMQFNVEDALKTLSRAQTDIEKSNNGKGHIIGFHLTPIHRIIPQYEAVYSQELEADYLDQINDIKEKIIKIESLYTSTLELEKVMTGFEKKGLLAGLRISA